jgi:acyl carrier protein
VFFAAGQNWYPQDVERLLERSGCVEHGKVALGTVRSDDDAQDRVLVFVQHRTGLEAFARVAAAVQSALAAGTGLSAHAVIPVHRLPRTSSGKLQRYRLAEDYRRGDCRRVLAELGAVSAASQSGSAAGTTQQRLLAICRRRFPGHDIQADRNLFELGADSLTLVSLHEDIETVFPGRVEITDLFDYPTVRELAAYLDG